MGTLLATAVLCALALFCLVRPARDLRELAPSAGVPSLGSDEAPAAANLTTDAEGRRKRKKGKGKRSKLRHARLDDPGLHDLQGDTADEQ